MTTPISSQPQQPTPDSGTESTTQTGGSSEHETSGMRTNIVVVDGADGLTPDMLRVRKVEGVPVVYSDDVPPGMVYGINTKYMAPENMEEPT